MSERSALKRRPSAAPNVGAPDAARVRKRLLRWYRTSARDFFWRDGPGAAELTRFQVLLVEFLLWKTNAQRSHAVIREIVERYPSPHAVLERTVEQLESELRPLGLYKRRARCLLVFSQQLVECHAGEVPATPEELETLTGIGQYAARATACVLAGSRIMPVDVNTSRIFGRLFGSEGPGVRTPTSVWDRRMDAFVPKRDPKRFLWATMDLAAAHCTARAPRCQTCPLAEDCATGRSRGTEPAEPPRPHAAKPTPRRRT